MNSGKVVAGATTSSEGEMIEVARQSWRAGDAYAEPSDIVDMLWTKRQDCN